MDDGKEPCGITENTAWSWTLKNIKIIQGKKRRIEEFNKYTERAS
jgi:hypothetical protein